MSTSMLAPLYKPAVLVSEKSFLTITVIMSCVRSGEASALQLPTRAFHNSAVGFEPPKCYPGTRLAIKKTLSNGSER